MHRIGQQRETKVEILVTEGTFEEDIAKRSTVLRSDEEEKLYSRNLIEVSLFQRKTCTNQKDSASAELTPGAPQNPRFVYPEKEEMESFSIRFAPLDEVCLGSSEASTPTETLPTTPITPSTGKIDIAERRIRVVPPGPSPGSRDGAETSISSGIELRADLHGDLGDTSSSALEGRKKKKARVAFA